LRKKLISNWKVKLKRKIHLVKWSQKFKRMRIKIDIKIKATLWLKGGIEKKITKRSRKKIRNQNNKNHTRKNNTISLNLIIKLKTNKFLQKGHEKKLKLKE